MFAWLFADIFIFIFLKNVFRLKTICWKTEVEKSTEQQTSFAVLPENRNKIKSFGSFDLNVVTPLCEAIKKKKNERQVDVYYKELLLMFFTESK